MTKSFLFKIFTTHTGTALPHPRIEENKTVASYAKDAFHDRQPPLSILAHGEFDSIMTVDQLVTTPFKFLPAAAFYLPSFGI
jgi:hypothetical protein